MAPPPPTPAPAAIDEDVEPASSVDDMDTGLQYDRYLKNILKILESDSELKNKLETAELEDIRNGKISNEIQGLPADLRRKLNEEKQAELTRLRKMTAAAAAINKGEKIRPSAYLKSIAEHLDHKSSHTFGPDDLTQLIQAATKDLNMFDEERHEEYKKHEMQKELRRKEKMKKLDEQQREKAEEDHRKRMEELAQQQKINHPGSKAQLEEVWNEEDELADMDFNPKTFFKLHDLNGDGVMDAGELEALFEKDLGKIYDPNDPNYDPFQFEEEKRQMREHVMKEVDKNGDGLISLNEFLTYSESEEFDDPDLDSYQTIDQKLYEHSVYTKDELDRYKSEIASQEAAIKEKLEVLKAEAKQLGQMRVEHGETKLKVEKVAFKSSEPVSEEQQDLLQMQKEEIKQQEEKLQVLHKDLQETSKDIIDKKQELTKHQASDKLVENLQKRLENLPPGEQREKEEARAEKELENIKKVQGLVPEEHPDPAGQDPVPSDETAPPPPK